MNSFYPFSKPGLSPQDTKKTNSSFYKLTGSVSVFSFWYKSSGEYWGSSAEYSWNTHVCVSTNSSIFVQFSEGYISVSDFFQDIHWDPPRQIYFHICW